MKLNLGSNFRKLFIISLIWLLLEGIFRKWFFYSFAGPIFYIKYILFGLTYFLYFLNYFSLPPVRKIYQYFILIFVLICFFGLLNNKLNNPIIVGLIGVTVHLLFIPVIHLNQFLFINLKSINVFSKILAYISIPICILGMIQFYFPFLTVNIEIFVVIKSFIISISNGYILNGFTNDDQLISRVGGFTRISSIFSFVKIYNAYLLFSVTFLGVVLLNKLLNSERILIYVLSIVLLIINMFMTGSRLPLMLMGFNFIIIGIYAFISFNTLHKTVFVTFLFGFISIIFLYMTTSLVKDPIDATIWRFEKAESRHRTERTGYTDIQLRMEDRLDIFKFSNEASWFGYGIGMTYQGAKSLIKNPIPFYFEEEGERLVLELGVIGVTIVLLMRLMFFIFAFGFLKNCKSVEIKLFLLALTLLITPPLLTMQMTTFSYLENFFYYFSFGLIIALYKIYSNEDTVSK